MKASQFSDAEGVHWKQGAGGVPVAESCRRAGICQATYVNWKKKYEGLTPPEMRRLKLLDEHYKSRRRDHAGVEARIKEIAQAWLRHGYRRVHVLLRRKGWTDNLKRIYRILRVLGLQLRKRPPSAGFG